ncbi:MAG TPA: C45 family autoproteolytic acyltransferase/hydrolase, partial [Candidatus Desulfaltia sp.]|nr:C45 family autoproteolytic acyltransferase/hydrolase [Candidatus Desulfaltia sp.]
RWKADLEKTFSVPAPTYIAKLLEASDFQPAIERWTPGLLDEVRGIADGAGIDFETIYAFQLVDESWVMGADLGLSKCTTIAARKRGNSPALVSQTLDIPTFYHGFQTVLRIRGNDEEPGALVFTFPGFIAANGLNDRSVAVCVNAVMQLAYSAKGLPVAFTIRGILRQKSYEDAVRFLEEIVPAAPQNYLFGGPNKAASFERSAKRMVEFLPFAGAEFTYHTNHPLVNDDFNPKFIEGLKKRGMSLDEYKARCPRFKFLGQAFKDNTATLDLAVLKRVYSDRDSRINNSSTYGCTIMVLGDRPELHIAPGRPDEVPFEVVDFKSAKSEIRFGVCDWTIKKTGTPEAFELAAQLGLEGVQVSLVPQGESLTLLDKELQQAYQQAVEKTGVANVSFCIGELNNVPLKSDQRAERWVAEGIEVASTMNVGIILIPFFGKGDLKDDPAGIEAVVQSLKRLAPKAEQAGVILALESTLSAEAHEEIIEAVGSPAVAVYYDVGNSQEAGYDIGREIRLLGERIAQFHAKDYQDLFGKGSLDFAAVRSAMRDIGYSGWLVLEEVKLPQGMEQSIRKDLEYLKSVFAPGKKSGI